MSDFVVNHLLDGFLLTAFPVAMLVGVISFISPCVLPLVPGYLSFAAGFSRSRGKVLLGSILFVLGFSVLFILYGALLDHWVREYPLMKRPSLEFSESSQF